MPGPLINDVTPSWLKPENASVFDPAYRAPLRTIVRMLGLDDPQQIMAIGAPLSTGPDTGGVLDALAQKFPRFATAIKAYHGSPHDFEKFDVSKIGTGEGAQAYGHGLYFAEGEDTARYYRDSLQAAKRASEPVTYRGAECPSGTSAHRVLVDIADKGKDATIQALERDIKFNESYAPTQAALGKSYLDFAKSVDPAQIAVPQGKMYEVGINAHPDQFLDWDKPLSQQSAPVKQALRNAGLPEYPVRTANGALYDPPGSVAYNALENASGGGITNPAAPAKLRKGSAGASQTLRDAGVPGIKYLDQGSRAAGEGSRNYVVFDDSLVDILRKYGLLLPAVGAGGAAAAASAQQ